MKPAPSRYQRGSRLARMFSGLALIAVLSGVFCIDAANLYFSAEGSGVLDLADTIEGGFQHDYNYLARFVADNSLDQPYNYCGDRLTRARLTVALAFLDAANRQSDPQLKAAAGKTALLVTKQRLICSPLDGNAWLRLAMIGDQSGELRSKVSESLQLSYWSAPNEAWIIENRLRLATHLYLSGERSIEQDYVRDLRNFVAYESPNQIARSYVKAAPSIRALLNPIIAALAEPRKAAVVDKIDQGGLIFKAK